MSIYTLKVWSKFMHFITEERFWSISDKTWSPASRWLIYVDYLSNYNWERLNCVKDRMKESKSNNRQHTHLLSDGIQAGSSPRSFRVVALGTVCWFCLSNKPQWCVCSKPGALSTGFPAADTLEKMSASGFFLASFFGTPAVGRPCCCAQAEMLTLSRGGSPPTWFSMGRGRPLVAEHL